MDRLRSLLNHITAQLSVLSVSQRLAIGLCAALVVVSFLWLLQWSTSPLMVPMVSRELSFEDLDAAEQALRSSGVRFEVRGARLYVPPGERRNAQRIVHSAGALPEGSLFDMDAVVADSNPFQSPEARSYAQNYAKGNELAKIITTSPFVTSAAVLINPVTKRRLGGTTDVPTASVTVTLALGREMTHEVVEGFAKLVAGAVGGLKPHNVSIVDARTLRSHTLPHPEDAASFDVFNMVKRREDHYREKILGKLADIPGLQVEVAVELDTSRRVTRNTKHGAPAMKLEKTDSTDQSSSARSAEAGVQANMGQALSGGGQGGSNTSEKNITENFEPKMTQTETIEQMPFGISKVTAAVGIPRSFIVGVFRARYPDITDDPKDDDPAFVAVGAEQVGRVKTSVELIVMAKSPDDVEVDVYPDMSWTMEKGMWSRAPGGLALAQPDVTTFDTLTMVRTYGPQAGLATLAVVSLFMVMRVVRKSSEVAVRRHRSAADSLAFPEEEEVLTVGGSSVGQAEVSEGLLAGKEIDPEALRYQELGHEVTRLVAADPEGTAQLIRRWVEEG